MRKTSTKIGIEKREFHQEFPVGSKIYRADFDRGYYGIFVEEMTIEKYVMTHPSGPVKTIWEFGNTHHHRRSDRKMGNKKVFKVEECVRTLEEVQEKIKIQMNLVTESLLTRRRNNIEDIQGLKEILKAEIKDDLEFSRASNKIINQYKRIDLDVAFMKKIKSSE